MPGEPTPAAGRSDGLPFERHRLDALLEEHGIGVSSAESVA
jgi:hypothetical protein